MITQAIKPLQAEDKILIKKKSIMKVGTHALVSDNSGVSLLKIIKVLRKPANTTARMAIL